MMLMLQSVDVWEKGKSVEDGFDLAHKQREAVTQSPGGRSVRSRSASSCTHILLRSREVACIRLLLAIGALAIFSTGTYLPTYPAAYLPTYLPYIMIIAPPKPIPPMNELKLKRIMMVNVLDEFELPWYSPKR